MRNFICEATGANCANPGCKRGSCCLEQETVRLDAAWSITKIKKNSDGGKIGRRIEQRVRGAGSSKFCDAPPALVGSCHAPGQMAAPWTAAAQKRHQAGRVLVNRTIQISRGVALREDSGLAMRHRI
jgi:hypothetical protein